MPLRVYVEVSLSEMGTSVAHRHLHNVIAAKGYDLIYRKYDDGHDLLRWRDDRADGVSASCADWLST